MLRTLRTTLLPLLLAVPALAQQDDYIQCLQQFEQAYKRADFPAAAQWCRRAAEANPAEWDCWYYLAEAQFQLHLLDSAVQSFTQAIDRYEAGGGRRRSPELEASLFSKRAVSLEYLGEIARGRQDLEKALALNPKDPVSHRVMGEYLTSAGEFDQAIASYDEAEKFFNQPNVYGSSALELTPFGRGQARRLAGDTAGTEKEFRRMIDQGGKYAELGWLGLAWLYALPADPKLLDLPKAREMLRSGTRVGSSWYITETEAILALLEGDAAASVAAFHRVREYVGLAEPVFYFGLAELRTGARDRAIELLTRAADMNAGYRKRIADEPEFAAVRDAVLGRVADLGGKQSDERIAIKKEMGTAPLQLATIDGLVRTSRFAAALAELDQFVKDAHSDTLKKSAEELLARVRDWQGLQNRLVDALNKGGIKDPTIPFGDDRKKLTIKKAAADKLELAAPGASMTAPWSAVPLEILFTLLKQITLTEADWFALGCLALEHERDAAGEDAFIQCLAKGKKFAKEIDGVVARRRGVLEPPGGFVPWQGRLVTSEDRDNYKKGLVPCRGQWVPKDDKVHIEKNHEKIAGKWVPLTAEQLEKRGFVQYEGEWITKDEVARKRGEWAHAWEKQTEHYKIRTNKSEAMADKLGVALEDAYQEFAKFFGKKPPDGEKMTAFAFATFNDYQAYCDQVKQPDKVYATGFAPSEPLTLCGYDKLRDDQTFLETMVHESCHLFYARTYESAKVPSWVAEGMATYFEGFAVGEGSHLTWNHLSRMRLWAIQQAAGNRTMLKLDEFLGGDAGALIASDSAKALVFYAQAWAIFYFFHNTLDERYKKGFADFFEQLSRGSPGDLKKALGPAYDGVEAAFRKFVMQL